MPRAELLSHDELCSELRELIDSATWPRLTHPTECRITSKRVSEAIDAHSLGPRQAAGLWLLAGSLENSHRISQQLPDASGSYWHGIMHRFEGDFGNAKYWMHRAATHPIRQQLCDTIATHQRDLEELSGSGTSNNRVIWNELAFSPDLVAETLIDLVEKTTAKQTVLASAVSLITWWEWQLLFSHCSR